MYHLLGIQEKSKMLYPFESLMFLETDGVFGYPGVITNFAERLSASLPPVIYGNGNQTRDFILVDDIVVVSAIVLSAADADKKKVVTKADLEFEF